MTDELPDSINPLNFPAKLWRMVNNPANSAICWDLSGEVVVIDQLLFEELVLSPGGTGSEDNYNSFKTTNFSSFVRQLNLYGFKKVDSQSPVFRFVNDTDLPPDERKRFIHLFFNPNFRRCNPAQLVNMKRLTVDNKAKLFNGIDVKSRPPGKHLRSGVDNSLEKLLKKEERSSVGRGRKDSPHPYRKWSVKPYSGTPVPPPQRPPFECSYSTGMSLPYKPGLRCGVNYGSPNFTRIVTQNEQPYPSAYQFYPAGLMAMPFGVPIGYFPTYYPMDMEREWQRADLQNNNQQQIQRADINLNRVFQIADEVMQTQPINNLIEILPLENASTSVEHTVTSTLQTSKEALPEATKVKSEEIHIEVSK